MSCSDHASIPDNNRWPLDAAQRALLIECQLAPTDAQHITLMLDFSGLLDVTQFRAALYALVQRHPLLRAGIEARDSSPVYRIHDAGVYGSIELPLDICSEKDFDSENLDWRARQQFDLEIAPLWRCYIIQTADKSCRAVLVVHHLIADGQSLIGLQRELEQLYLGERLPEVECSHACDELPSTVDIASETLALWRDCAHPLWSSTSVASAYRYESKVKSQRIDGDEWLALRKAVRKIGTTLNLHCNAVLACVLSQHFQQDSLLISGVGHGRRNANDWARTGFFARPLIIACDLSFNPTYRAVLKRVGQAFKHAWAAQWGVQASPLAVLEPVRRAASQVACSFNDFSSLGRRWGEIDVTTTLQVPLHAGHVLRLALELNADGLIAHWQYQPALVSETLIDAWMQAWKLGLFAMLSFPDLPLDGMHLQSMLLRQQWQQQGMQVRVLSAMQSDLVRGEWIGSSANTNSFGIKVALDSLAFPQAVRDQFGDQYEIVSTLLSCDQLLALWQRAIGDVLASHPDFLWRVPSLQEPTFPHFIAVKMEHENASFFKVVPSLEVGIRFAEFVEKCVYQPYDLSNGPLIRNYFVRDENGHWHAVFCAHHVLLDAFSGIHLVETYIERFLSLLKAVVGSSLLKREFRPDFCYGNSIIGDSAFRDGLALSCIDKVTEVIDTEETLRFWGKQFSECAPLGFPGKFSVSNIEHITLGFNLDAVYKLQALCRQAGTTLANALRAFSAYVVAVLARPEHNFVMDELRQSPGRNCDEFGCHFISRPVVVTPTNLMGCTSVKDLLDYGKSLNRRYRLGEISRRWKKRLFQDHIELIYNFHQLPGSADGYQLWRPRAQRNQLHIVPLLSARGLEIEVGFDASCIPGRQLRQLLNRLLTQWLSGETCLRSLSWLDVEDQKLVAERVAGAIKQFPMPVFVDEWLSNAAEQWPDKCAVSDDVGCWNYSLLQTKIDLVAATLSTRYGLKGGEVVGVAMPRSKELLLAIIAVLRSGAVYMPVATDTPIERIQSMLDDSGCRYLIAADRVFSSVDQANLSKRVKILDIGDLQHSTSNMLNTNSRQPGDPCYLLFTSGSTGRPKGVLVSHEALHNRLMWMQSEFPLSTSDRVLQKTSIGFDVSLWELFWPCIAGATLCMASHDSHYNMAQLRADVENHDITVMHFVPTVLDEWLATPGLTFLPSLRWIFCSGEVLKPASVERLQEFTSATVVNLYGPTEAAIDVTYWSCARGKSMEEIPLGFVVANTEIHVVDALHRVLPVGCVGEMAICGIQLAQGYFRRPIENAKSFSMLQHGDESVRAYFTGDLGCFEWYEKESVVLYYLGRIDRQLKVNGIRVEPAGIENSLLSMPEVAQAAVTLVEGQLRAFVVTNAAAKEEKSFSIDTNNIRARLASLLPASHYPHCLQVVHQLPLTQTGKVDYRALSQLKVKTERFTPTSAIETTLSMLWETLLGQVLPDSNANFFFMGGHSLLVARLQGKIREEFNVDIPLAKLFSTPGFSDQARLVAESSPCISNAVFIAPSDGLPRLSLQQERLWFHCQRAPFSTAYHMPLTLVCRAELDVKRLRNSVHAVMCQHVMLRSKIVIVDGTPLWNVNDNVEVPLFEHDDGELNDALIQPFELENQLLFRVHLSNSGVHEWRIAFVFHHLIADGWTVNLLARQFMQALLYSTHSPQVDKSQRKTDYPDYVFWQRNHATDELNAARIYWLSSLDAAELRPLPYDVDKTSFTTRTVNRVKRVISADDTQLLRHVAKKHSTTLNAVLMTAWQIWQAKLSGTYKNVSGTVVASRPFREFEEVVGFFANTLPISCCIAPVMTVSDSIRHLGEKLSVWLQHSMVPLADIASEMTEHFPDNELFDALLVMEPPSSTRKLLPSMCEILEEPTQDAKYPVVLSVADNEVDLLLHWEFSSAHFSSAMAGRLAAAYVHVLLQIATNPEKTVRELCLISSAEATYLSQLGDGGSFRTLNLSEKMRHIARVRGDAVAVRFDANTLRYDQLIRFAGEWAQLLMHFKLQPGMRVGVLLPRGLLYASIVWSLFQNELCYVPLNPEDPALRHQEMIDDAQLHILIADSSLLEPLTVVPLSNASRVVMNTEMGACVVTGLNPNSETSCEEHRYIVYTSGSTGRPKGIVMEESVLSNLLQWQCEHSAASASWKTLHFATLGFDVAIQEILSTWLSGGELVLIADESRRNMEAVLSLLCNAHVQRLYMPDSALQALALTAMRLERYPTALHEVITAGERLQNTSALRRFFSLLPRARLINQYGPAESHVVSAYTLADEAESWPDVPPIGNAIVGAHLLVMDLDGQLMPRGVAGELYIGGCLAVSYWQQPQLTADRFVVCEMGGDSQRYYRSGDKVRINQQGEFEFLGRLDTQVKRNGYRIEPQEIETQLLNASGVLNSCNPTDALVVTEIRKSHTILVAYVQFDHQQTNLDSLKVLKQFLESRLPRHMQPDQWIEVTALPRSRNGKKLRIAVPDTLWVKPECTTGVSTVETALTDTEYRLAALWRTLLGEHEFTGTQSFFDCGGHSLLATRLLNAIQTTFGISFPLAKLFQHSSLQAMAALIDQGSEALISPVVARHTLPKENAVSTFAVPASFQQIRLWRSAYMQESPQIACVPLALRIEGSIDPLRFEAALLQIMERHETLRTHLVYKNHRLLQVVAPHAIVTIADTDAMAGYTDEQIMAWVGEKSRQNIPLDSDSLMRVCWLQLAENDQVVMFLFHHLIMDGASLAMFLKDFLWFYVTHQTSTRSGNPPNSASLPLQYADYCMWQQTVFPEAAMAETSLISNEENCYDDLAPTCLPVPDKWRGATEFCELPRDTYNQFIKRFCVDGVTPTHALLALCHQLLGRLQSAAVSSIAMPVSHRHHAGTSEILGLFADSITSAVIVKPDEPFSSLVQQTRRSCVSALSQQDDQLARNARHADSSIAPIMFQWVPGIEQQGDLGMLQALGWRVRRITVDMGVSGRALALQITETESVVYLSALYQTARYDASTIRDLLAEFQDQLAVLAVSQEVGA